jgi:hypothetical protein
MTETRTKEVTEYFNICKTCEKEFTVSRGRFSQKICYPCQEKASVAKAKRELKHLIGGKIVNIEPATDGLRAYSQTLVHIDVLLKSGVCVRFTKCDGDGDGQYIEWEGHGCPE